MRTLVSVASGALFGLGLMLSGMTDTTKVQGWLDLFGDWDPTLAFVLGGALLPMLLAWRIAARRRTALSGAPFPAVPGLPIDRQLLAGSALFGVGWALAGFCPGPAIAALAWGGTGTTVFVLAMAGGMLAFNLVQRRPAPAAA